MAGGRRPANFATSGSRHTPSATDQAAGYYSIWQQPRITSASSPPNGPRPQGLPAAPPYIHLATSTSPVLQEAPVTPAAAASAAASVAEAVVPTVANALATALEAAVATAVSRALSSVPGTAAGPDSGASFRDAEGISLDASGNPFSLGSAVDKQDLSETGSCQDDHARSVASSSYNHVVGSSSAFSASDPLNSRIAEVEERFEFEMTESKREVEALRSHIAKLERTLVSFEERASLSQQTSGALETRFAATEEIAKRSVATASSAQDAVSACQRSIADLRLQKRKADSDSERYRSRLATLESQMESQGHLMESLPQRLASIESGLAEAVKLRKTDALAAGEDAASLSVRVDQAVQLAEESTRNGADSLEALAGIRSRVKRLETVVESEGKRSEDASTELALQSGALERLRSLIGDTSASVQGLKRLVETNLRSHSSAEGIVKDQAQLITRHVCVALRQFISRRITENNLLIDKTLRARVPAYAEASDEFVLVRETESVDEIPVTSPNSSEKQNSGARTHESMAVLPRDILDGALGGEPHALATLMQ